MAEPVSGDPISFAIGYPVIWSPTYAPLTPATEPCALRAEIARLERERPGRHDAVCVYCSCPLCSPRM